MSKVRAASLWRTKVSKTVIVLLIAVYAIPLIWMLLTSFKQNSAIFADRAGIICHPSFHAYASMIRHGTLGRAALNSGFISVGTTAITLVI